MSSDTYAHFTANKRHNVTQSNGEPSHRTAVRRVVAVAGALTMVCIVSAVLRGEHLEHNPILKTLLTAGVKSADGKSHRLPKPIMADGLTAAQQDATIRQALEGKPVEPYLRDSVVAPHICQLSDGQQTDEYTIRQVDYWFIAYANLDALKAEDFAIQDSSSEETITSEISPASLKSRQIPVPAGATEYVLGEAYGHLRYRLLNKVELAATGHAFVSRQPDSILAAGLVDRRFVGDAEFPNQWQPLERNEVGKLITGKAEPYDGGGGYLKATRLAGHEGALFVEGHLLLIEPIDWFRGTNQLRGKLPAIIQNQIRDVRRAMLKASRSNQ